MSPTIRNPVSFPRRLGFYSTLAAAAVAPLVSFSAERPRDSGTVAAAAAWQRFAAQSHAALAALNQPDRSELPPLPAGVTDLAFAEIFGPVGDRGLEYSAKMRALDGRVVRLAGYMVREPVHAPGIFIVAGWPLRVDPKGGCSADALPATAVHVVLPSAAARPVPYRPGRFVLFGRIEIGPRPEADGRISAVRLFLDAPSAALIAPPAGISAP